MKVILITGCASGFGYLTALKFARNGWTVAATVRTLNEGAKSLEEISKKENLPLEVLKMDVTKQGEVDKTVPQILKKYGHIDVLVNNAGFGYLGPIEEFDLDEVHELYDVNIFGTLRMIHAVLPSMREHRSGRIINFSSICGLLSFALYGMYSSSKFAIETISETLRFEVKPFGVDVTMVEPGGFSTNFQQNSKKTKKSTPVGPYAKLKNPAHDETSSGAKLKESALVRRLTNPQKVADKIYEIANAKQTRIRYTIGVDAKIYTFIRKILPDFLWESLLHWAYKY